MKTYTSVNSFEQVHNAVVTIGTFDGVHTGHRMLIGRLKAIAANTGGQVVVLTFHPHPRAVIHNDGNPVRLLSSLREKALLLAEAGVDHLVVQPFDEAFGNLSAAEFVEDVLFKKLKTNVLVVGYDHRFGKNREGGFSDLLEASVRYGFSIERIPEQIINQMTVSSTKIRNALTSGDLETADALLGRHYRIMGTVVHGKKLGRQLGFPTANIEPETADKLIPAEGVYVVNAYVNGRREQGLLSIGRRPTIEIEGKLSVEVYLMDFNDDIYGKQLEVELLQRVRGDQKFDSLDGLVSQMNLDLEFARKYFGKQ